MQDESLHIGPDELLRWYPSQRRFINIADTYNGDDCWLGPYFGADAHGGLDVNQPLGTVRHHDAAGERRWFASDPARFRTGCARRNQLAEETRWIEPAVSRAVGTFDFADGIDGFVEISSAGSRGQVCADAVIFKPLMPPPAKKYVAFPLILPSSSYRSDGVSLNPPKPNPKTRNPDVKKRKRKSQGFNAVTFVLGVPNGTELIREPTNFYGVLPFERVNNHFDPARPIITAGSDPTDPNQYDYWDHVDQVVGLSRSLGLYAILLPTWGTGIAGSYDGKDTKDIIFDAPKAEAYSVWLAKRYGSQPHVLWMIGGDRSAVSGENDYRPVFRALASGFARLAPTQLLSFHPRKAAPQSGDWFHQDPWLAFNSNQHWPERQVAAIAADWAREPAKPTWLFEGRYEGYWRGNAKPGDWGAWQVRQQAYQTVFAGAFGHTYGHERVFGFGADGVDWTTFLDAPGALNMSYLARLMTTFQTDELVTRVPDQALLATSPSPPERLRSNYIAATRSGNGSIAMFYSASGRPIGVRLERLPSTTRFAFWFNPRSGQWHRDGGESHEARAFASDIKAGPDAGIREFAPPMTGDDTDWVLVLAARESL